MSPHERYLSTRYFSSLDGLRCVSILAVIWHHAAGAHRAGIGSRGHHGVSLFFAISGFLITTLLLRERAQTGGISLKGFYLRRTLRIFPLYYAVVALYAVMVAIFDSQSQAGAEFYLNLPSFLSYTSNWFVDYRAGTRVIFYFGWSLATEEQFYLFWPWVMRWGRTWYAPVLFMVGLVAVDQSLQAAVAGGLLDGSHLWVRMATSIATPICLGCLGAHLLNRPQGFRLALPLFGLKGSDLAWAVLTALALGTGAEAVVDVAVTGWVLACAARPDGWLAPFLANRAVRYVGTVSYGMYLLHMLALNAARRLLPGASDWVLFLSAAALSIAAASLSHRFFERRFLELKDRLAQRAPQAAPSGP